MKKFLRTVTGKTILYLSTLISLCIVAFSFMTVVVLTGYFGIDFYTYNQEEITDTVFEKVYRNNYRSLAYSYLHDYLNGNKETEHDSNISYKILDKDNNVLISDLNSNTVVNWTFAFSFDVLKDEYEVLNYEDVWSYEIDNDEIDTVSVLIYIKDLTVTNNYKFIKDIVHIFWLLRYIVYVILTFFGLLAFITFIALMSVSGRRPGSDELYINNIDKIPFDVFSAVVLGAILFAFDICIYELRIAEYVFEIIPAGLIALACLALLLGYCMSTATRFKSGSLFTNTVIYKVLRFTFRLLKRIFTFFISCIKNIPMVRRTCLVLLAICIYDFLFVLLDDAGLRFFLYFAEKIVLIPAVIYFAVCIKKLMEGAENLASGNLEYKTDTSKMILDFKKHGENLNSIADGINIAVEERTKSERMKTELITNVSHDIKTPLTSIINYAELISTEETDNENIKEYSCVLVRQSEKLKRLIEDLVEASKASTGNLDVELTPCDVSVFISQAAGEYEDKLNNANLSLVVKQPENEIRIMADGRRMWRIFDNLMNNICKYAQSGTRVYLSLVESEKNAVITFKNTSREELDMSEDELMERFTRGDSSRNTEGNGLGLSIAKSMAELQGGSLNLSIDGDLFKAILKFPKI